MDKTQLAAPAPEFDNERVASAAVQVTSTVGVSLFNGAMAARFGDVDYLRRTRANLADAIKIIDRALGGNNDDP